MELFPDIATSMAGLAAHTNFIFKSNLTIAILCYDTDRLEPVKLTCGIILHA